jgi:hypothetical protein
LDPDELQALEQWEGSVTLPLRVPVARRYIESGRYDEAIRLLNPCLRAVARHSPPGVLVHWLLLEAHRRAGESRADLMPAAQELLATVDAMLTWGMPDDWRLHAARGSAQLALANADQAVDELVGAVKTAPAIHTAVVLGATLPALIETGRLEVAHQILDEIALQGSPRAARLARQILTSGWPPAAPYETPPVPAN